MNVLYRRGAEFCRYYAAADVAKYVHEHCPGRAAEVIRQAELLLGNTFVYTDRWDMEPCAVPYTVSLEDWVTSPNGDPEWVFMLNRHDFLHKLWQAYLLTGKDGYVEKLRLFLMDWIEKNPITPDGTDATRTIDTGIRCMNWSILLLQMLGENRICRQDAERVLESLAQQCRNMRQRYIGKYALSNWGVLQTTAICAAHLWFPEWIDQSVADWAWQELKQQLSLQILSDGSHWEQSPMYHVEVLNTCVKLLAQLRMAQKLGQNRDFSPICEEKAWTDAGEAAAGPGEGFEPERNGWLTGAVRVLSRHVLYTCDPAWFQLPLGDSDVTDVRDVLARAAALLPGGGIYRSGAGEWMDPDSAFLLGAPGLDAFHGTAALRPHQRIWECADSGNMCFRSGWSADASFTALKCGTLGSSHGHADQTHISLYYKGKPFLVDSGRYTYVEEDPLRVLLKRPSAHNVCVIDDCSGGEPNGSWSYHSYDETLKNYCKNIENTHYAQMGFYGTIKGGSSYLVNRRILAVDGGIWLSAQDAICAGAHTLTEYIHLHGGVSVQRREDDWLLRSGGAELAVIGPGWTLGSGVISEKYNEKHTAPVLIRTERMHDRATGFTLLVDGQYQVNSVPVYQLRRAEPVPAEVAAAWDIIKPDGKRYTLILWSRETCRGDKLYTCHGVSVYGKAVVLAWDGENSRTIRLKV